MIRETHRRLASVLGQIPEVAYEVVDDGSGGDTLDILRELQSSDRGLVATLVRQAAEGR